MLRNRNFSMQKQIFQNKTIIHCTEVVFLFAMFFMLPNFANASDITACGTISSAGTYVLQNDITADGTCMTINSGSVVLDLNGHTITYNTAAGDSVYGVLVSWNKVGVRITNGTLRQGPGNGYKSSAVYSLQARNVEFDHLTIYYQGDNNGGIEQNGGGFAVNVNIHDNFIYPNGTKRIDPQLGYATHYGGFSAINVYGSGGAVTIANNYIEGKGNGGIGFGYAMPLTQTLQITGNTVKMASLVRDGYAIAIGSGTNDDIGFEIANNTIVQSSGRGILVAGNLNANSPGPGLGSIHHNSIDVREARDSGEYNAPGTGIGIQLRFGVHNVKIYENTVRAHAGASACPRQFPESKGDDCIAIGIKVGAGQNGVNNQVYNNTIEVDTTDGSLIAMGLYATVASNGSNIFYGNTVTSNSIIVDTNDNDGNGSNFLFHSNTFIKGTDPKDFHSIRAAYWIRESVENVYLDNAWLNGASVDDILYTGSGTGANYSLYVKWYLNVSVKDQNGQSLSGATVVAVSGGETVSGTTDLSGNAKLILTNYKRYGTTWPGTINYTQYSPHIVSVTKNGYLDDSANVTMDATKSLSFALVPALNDGIAPAAPQGLSVQ